MGAAKLCATDSIWKLKNKSFVFLSSDGELSVKLLCSSGGGIPLTQKTSLGNKILVFMTTVSYIYLQQNRKRRYSVLFIYGKYEDKV